MNTMGFIHHFHVVAATLLAFATALPASAMDQPSSRFGAAIVFTPSAYTPQGITSLAHSPLPSEDRSLFGTAIAFTSSTYTPQGIMSLAYSPLPSEDHSLFGAAIVFTPGAQALSGIERPHLTAATP